MKRILLVTGPLFVAAALFCQNTQRPSAATAPKNKAAAPAAKEQGTRSDFTSTLERGLSVAGSAKHVVRTQDRSTTGAGYTLTDTWGEWTFDISATNQTDIPLRLDNTIFIVETDKTDTTYHGYMTVREERVRKVLIPPVIVQRESTTSDGVSQTKEYVYHGASYDLPEYSAFDGRGLIFSLGGGSSTKFYTGRDPNFKSGQYGTLAKGTAIRFNETVAPFSWLNAETRESVCFVLPEVHIGSASDLDSYQPIALMQQDGDANNWKVGRLIVLHETAAVLETALTSKNYGLFTRVLAANRLAEYYPDQASAAFASVSKNLREGELLVCMISLAGRMKTKALLDHCRDLASDSQVPQGISDAAKAYLKAIEGDTKQLP
ncbi:MAG: hypothetical protein ABSC23_12735 [Bryobacteraceae bacterium]|jgi:hypothetical protein